MRTVPCIRLPYLSIFLTHLAFSKRGPALHAVVANHHGPLDVVGGGHVLVGSEERLEETTFFASGCRTAREMQEDITRIRRLRDEALELADLAANSPQSAVFDRPDEGIGYRIGKVQKRVFDEIKVLRAKGLERRADNLPPADQRRMP